MNNKRRNTLLKLAVPLLQKASDYVSQVLDAEEDALDNIPENLCGTERCENIESAVDSLNEAIESIDSAKESIEAAAE